MPKRLSCHPKTPCEAASSIEVDVAFLEDNTISLRYDLVGDVEGVVFPAPARPGRVDGLWQHTCFELFVRHASQPNYVEFNFSPSSEWAAYLFSGYRKGMKNLEDIPTPLMVLDRGASAFHLAVSKVFVPFDAGQLRVGVSAVIEESDGRMSYWALTHPGDKPDFHHPDGFALDIGATEIS